MVSREGTRDIYDSFSTQDEAYMRLWLHENDAAVRYHYKT